MFQATKPEQLSEAEKRILTMNLPMKLVTGIYKDIRFFSNDLDTFTMVNNEYMDHTYTEMVDFEIETGFLVYLVVSVNLGFLKCESYLCVSNDKDSWDEERSKLRDIYPYIYSKNKSLLRTPRIYR